MLPIIILLGLVVFFAIWVVSMYNGLIGKKNQVEYAFAGIDVQLKKRRDLIPNLVAAVKEYMKHERELLENITALRSQVMSPNISDKERFAAENQLGKQLGKLQIAIENYPDLKANTNVMDLQRNLTEVESQIAASRRAYNASVMSYNNGLEMFPSNIIAGMMRLERKEPFEIPAEERENVDVSDLFNS
ncbi:MAG: LemA family protein [Flavobacteriales bacterium]|nr:LemA family protein [Flavobacteriales bacterium]